MPSYEIVAHLTLELEDTTPEAAAAAFKARLLAGLSGSNAVRGLAVWRPAHESAPTPLPVPLQQQLAEFFAGVARCAAAAEEVFRTRVEDIFANEGLDAALDIPDRMAVAVEVPKEAGREADDWGGERSLGLATRRGRHDDLIGLPWS